MRTVLLWLMMFGVFAGLSARAVPTLHLHYHSHAHEEGHDAGPWHHVDEDDHHHHDGDHSSHDGQDCPTEDESDPENPLSQDHHHHHVSVSPAPIAAELVTHWTAPLSECLLLEVHSLSLSAPEGPYLDLDAPPLI